MNYKSIYSIEYQASDDMSAEKIARIHHRQLHDELRVEGADHPSEFVLEQVLALEPTGQRALLPEPTVKSI